MAFLLLFCEHHFFASIIAIRAMMTFPTREVFELKLEAEQSTSWQVEFSPNIFLIAMKPIRRPNG
jgi:hypothetical protein